MGAVRGAPAIADRNRSDAIQNITAKIQTMHRVCSEPQLNTEHLSRLPSSLAQFNRWKLAKDGLATGLPERNLLSNGPQTLRKETGLTVLVGKALSRLSEISEGRRLSGKRAANLEARLALSERLRTLAEDGLCDAVEASEVLRVELVKEKARSRSEAEKANEEIRLLREELQTERDRSSDLTKTVSKLTRIGKGNEI